MNKGILIFILLLAVIFAAGCKGGVHGDVYVEDDHHHDSGSPADTWPYLLDFHIIDSYGISTEDDYYHTPELDPYEAEGIFDVYWDADVVNDYIVEYRINDIPAIDGSRLIDAELCGIGLPCDLQGWQICQYNADFSMSCDVSTQAYEDINSTYDPLYFDDLVSALPETLYFVMQVCDTLSSYCEYDTKPLLLY